MAKTVEERTQDYVKQIGRAVRATQLQTGLMLTPESLKVYKPTRSGSGAAIKFDLRLVPKWGKPKSKPGDGPTIPFVESVGGGMFMELARQVGEKDGHAVFGWQKPDQVIVVKLGLPDLSAILCGIECRWSKRALVNPKKNTNDTVGLFHQTPGGGTKAIDYKLVGDGAIIRVSQGKGDYISIKLSLAEELQMRVYFEHAMKMLMLTGMR